MAACGGAAAPVLTEHVIGMRRLTNEPLFVDPALAGARLASPMRRILAIAVDGCLLLIPTIVVAVAVAFVSLQGRDPRATHAALLLIQDSFRPASKSTSST